MPAFDHADQKSCAHVDRALLQAQQAQAGVGLPIASTQATNNQADTKRYDGGCIRTFFDRMADIILSIHRAVADRLGGI
jgi:hypothetical protein